MKKDVLLKARNVKKYFPIKSSVFEASNTVVKAVDDISLNIYRGETLGIVGESGCGKSTLGRVFIRLLEPTDGKIYYEGEDMTRKTDKQLRSYRQKFQMVFQDPYSSLNPRMTVGKIIEEPLVNFSKGNARDRQKTVEELLDIVGLPKNSIYRFPYEFSGGQRQRIGIARAISLNPKLIVADEPVSALDVSVQSQVLNLLKDIQKEFNLTYMFISHDLSVVDHLCDRIAVMYLGRIVEISPKKEFYEESYHPYSQALLSAIPHPDPKVKRERIILPGDVPSPTNPPRGCPFHPRCATAMDICEEVTPRVQDIENDRFVACHLYE